VNTRRPIPENLTVPGGKIGGYLLNPAHPSGGSKAKFFRDLGFSAVDTGGLTKMVCEGPLRTPSGRWTRIRSVWVITGANDAQLVTAVPARDRPRTSHGP
jgi:hypothetical protein